MFIDKARIRFVAGKGGDGAVSFHREKYVAAGGPDGGDGGNGGSIYLVADDHLSTLADYKYRKKYQAEDGENGRGNRCHGKSAEDLILKVPRGTIVREYESGQIMADVSSDEPVLICKGGRGGFGNAKFATPTRQIPRFAKTGTQGEAYDISLELKLIADVGLIGFPNVGKSTLLSVVSNAKPKIANYHFTTLSPNLGVVKFKDTSFVAADIPGLIEGASKGIGLGYDFLRHIERCRLLVHIVDVSGSEGRDPISDFEQINAELSAFNAELASRQQIVVGNKIDLADEDSIERFRSYLAEKEIPCFFMSAITTEGTQAVVAACAEALSKLPPVKKYEPDFVKPEKKTRDRDFQIERDGSGEWEIIAPWLERILMQSNIEDYESLMYFQNALADSGILDKLEELGVQEGDSIHIGDYQFDYIT
ncbi:MAG: GTPase ObgE [Oscillospiraceae bacterium]|nr:GTPase ObgE [Oscillospiraceae bacterium]